MIERATVDELQALPVVRHATIEIPCDVCELRGRVCAAPSAEHTNKDELFRLAREPFANVGGGRARTRGFPWERGWAGHRMAVGEAERGVEEPCWLLRPSTEIGSDQATLR